MEIIGLLYNNRKKYINNVRQGMQCTYNLTLRLFQETIVVVEKLYYMCECVCVFV
jgi:hypothetical protein